MDEILVCSREGGVATMRLNRPKARNALNRELREALQARVAELDADESIGAIVLTGTDPAFCAGVDFRELEAGGDAAEGIGPRTAPFLSAAIPLIGAINGAAYTGGLELALACHVLVASERATFADTHTRLGFMPGWGLSVLLSDAVGARRAREMSLTSAPIDAQTAYHWGLVNRVVPHDQLQSTALELARQMSAHGRTAAARVSRLYDAQAAARNAAAWQLEAAHFVGAELRRPGS
jgi:enoyl-CoA hydratase